MVYTNASVGFSISTKSWQLFPFKFTEWTQSKILNYDYRIYLYIYIYLGHSSFISVLFLILKHNICVVVF